MFSLKHLLAPVVVCTLGLAACGGGSSPPPAPVFTTVPPTIAAEGSPYSYVPMARDPAGGTVTITLSSAPTGASMSAGTLSWTPTRAQSRLSNQLTLTAMSSEGGKASQSWTLTPSGTVNGSWIDTYWEPTGPVHIPINWAIFGLTPKALIPQADGSVVTLNATVQADGSFSIPNVPGGYYWFQFSNNAFWTSSSTIDFGADISGRRLATTPTSQTTTFQFTVDGLNPVQRGDQFAFFTDLANPFNIGFSITSPSGSTAMNATFFNTSNLDYSTAKTGFLLQYEPTSAGSFSGIALGTELAVPSLSLTNGITNTLSGTLAAPPVSSFNLSVKGSEWSTAFQNVAPGTAVPVDAFMNVFAQPYIPADLLASTARFDLNLPLFLPNVVSTGSGFLLGWSGASSCVDTVQFSPLNATSHPAVVSDQDFGLLQFSDPFPSEWKRVFSFCQTASFEMPIPGSSSTAPVLFGTGQNTSTPAAPVGPLIFPVKNPMINGTSLFTANAVNAAGVTLSWSEPDGAAPYGYKVALFLLRPRGDGTSNYFPAGTFITGKTSMTLPPLQSGQTYVMALSARVDGKADVENSPNRSGLPTAYATVVSAPITTN
jgi:hypothetical protein